jgi:hypothetical protein
MSLYDNALSQLAAAISHITKAGLSDAQREFSG